MLVSFVLLTVTVVAVTVIFYSFRDLELQSEGHRSSLQSNSPSSVVPRKPMLEGYHSYQVIPIGGTEADAENRIRIPIERAMESIVADARSPQAQAEDVNRGTSIDSSRRPTGIQHVASDQLPDPS